LKNTFPKPDQPFTRKNLVSQREKETHKCAATTCTIEVPKRFLMCGQHWQMLPYSIQQRVWHTFNPSTLAQIQAYHDARDEAIEYVRCHS